MSENFKFIDNTTARSDHNKFDAVFVRARRSVGPREELSVDYEESYEFKWIHELKRCGQHCYVCVPNHCLVLLTATEESHYLYSII